MRIAWLGPEPSLEGGVPYAATLLLQGLAAAGVEIDAYVATVDAPYGSTFDGIHGLRVVPEAMSWSWDRWYAKHPLGALLSGQAARATAQRSLVKRLRAEHARRPYDLIYQFSQFEVPWLDEEAARQLPAVIVHPEVHAMGELRWHWRERRLARDQPGQALAAAAIYAARSAAQRRTARRLDGFIAPSSVFADALEHDCGVPRERIRVVANPIDVDRFRPAGATRDVTAPLELLFVSRIAVRKGVDMIIDLSHRLADLEGEVLIRVIGTKSLFSDYRGLLSRLHRGTAVYEGSRPGAELAETYRHAHALLQPSHYEPFALTVGEALASGIPAVVSDQVGAAEFLDGAACRTFPAGDADAFERAVRELVTELRSGQAPQLFGRARDAAESALAVPVVSRQLATALSDLAANRAHAPGLAP